MPTVLITGCDRGIGKEFARQYAAADWSVIATYKSMDNCDSMHKTMRHFALDVTHPGDFVNLKNQIGEEPIDLLVSNAGIGLETDCLGSLDFDYVRTMYEVNTMGPLRLIDTFVDNVAISHLRRYATVTSRMGSIGLNLTGGHYGYRASKAGLNAIMRSLAIDLFSRGINVVCIHPGWVDTAGGGHGDAAIPVAESVEGMRNVIRKMGSHETGQIFTFDGTPLLC